MVALYSNRARRANLSLGVSLLLLAALRLSASVAWAQTPEPDLRSSQAQIAHQLELIHIAEQEHRAEAERGRMWARLALQYHADADFMKAEDAYSHAIRLLKDTPSARAEYAAMLGDLAALYLIYGRVDEAERIRKQALAVRVKLGDPVDIGVSEVHLADIAYARHQYKKAERLALSGIKEMSSSSTPPKVGMLSGFITVTYARCFQDKCAEGLVTARQAAAFASTHFDPDSAAIGFGLETLGFAEWKNGAPQEGERDMVQGIQILRKQLVAADPRLAGALLQYRDYLTASSRRAEAEEIHEEVERMKSQTGGSCATCTVSVYSLSNTLR